MKHDISKVEAFCEPSLSIFSATKDTKIMVGVVNLVVLILGIQRGGLGSYIFGGIGIVLGIAICIIRKTSNKKFCTGCGFAESIFLLILWYGVSYQEYAESGLDVRPYIVYTQLVGWCITGICIPAFTRRLRLGFMDKDITSRSIIIGYIASLLIVIGVFGGLIILYFTVFNKSMNLVTSSKILYVALCTQVIVAYYITKLYLLIRYDKLLYKSKRYKKKINS